MDAIQPLQLLLHLDHNLDSVIAQHGSLVYLILFAIVTIEIGIVPLFFLPGDPLIFLCGAYCATGALSVPVVIPVLLVATVTGSVMSYASGLAIGKQVFTRDYRWLDRSALQRTHAFYERYGRLTFLLSPFIAVVRTFAPFVAGVARMTFTRFLSAASVGAAIWIITLVGSGYWFGNIPVIRTHMSAIVLCGIGIGVGSLVASALWRRMRARHRD